MKKIKILTSILILAFLFTSCQSKGKGKEDEDERLKVFHYLGSEIVPGKRLNIGSDSKVYFTDGTVKTFVPGPAFSATDETIVIADFFVDKMIEDKQKKFFSHFKEDEKSINAAQKFRDDFLTELESAIPPDGAFSYPDFISKRIDKIKADSSPYLKEDVNMESVYQDKNDDSIPSLLFSLWSFYNEYYAFGMEIETFPEDEIFGMGDNVIYIPKSGEMKVYDTKVEIPPVSNILKIEIVIATSDTGQGEYILKSDEDL